MYNGKYGISSHTLALEIWWLQLGKLLLVVVKVMLLEYPGVTIIGYYFQWQNLGLISRSIMHIISSSIPNHLFTFLSCCWYPIYYIMRDWNGLNPEWYDWNIFSKIKFEIFISFHFVIIIIYIINKENGIWSTRTS